MEDEKYETYLFEERKSLLFAMLEQVKSFDRWVLTLSAGTFGLSLIFIGQVVPQPKSGTICYLITAWSFFALSILSTLSSFLLSNDSCYKQIQSINKLINREIDRTEELPLNVYGRITRRLNYGSMSTFLIGVIFIIIFAALNLLGM